MRMFADLAEVAAFHVLHHYLACAEQALSDRILTYMEDGVLHKLEDEAVILSLHTVARALGFTLEEVA